jgi:hypothetical protein
MINLILNKIFLIFIGKAMADNSPSLTNQIAQKNIKDFLLKIPGYLIPIAGALMVCAILWGGATYLTATGNPENETKGKNILIGAIVGIIIVALAWVFVTQNFK